ncbi:hypothetical protein MMC08_005707 [Hypocenomyce scalaris]|nr:hypothetical protein [Hypocenomyce scalaris]
MATTFDIDALAKSYLHTPKNFDIIRAQIEHRVNIVQQWGIAPGSKVLEIGPGQGDCTIVLAAAVGDHGHVTAVDPADLNYGSPYTLGQSQSHISSGPLGPRITFLQTDPSSHLRSEVSYDYVVFFHSVWYFSSPSTLSSLLRLCLPRTSRVLITEHSLHASSPEAVPHVLAALAHMSLEALKPVSTGNIRTAVSPDWVKQVSKGTGWSLVSERVVVPERMLWDGKWEVYAVIGEGFLREVEEVCGGDEKKGAVLMALRDSVIAAVKGLDGGKDGVRGMDVWTGVFERVEG